MTPGWRWPDPPLVGDDFRLRRWRPDDADSLVAHWHDPAIVAMGTVPSDPTRYRAAAWIAGVEARARGAIALDLVISDVDDDVLGEVGLVANPNNPRDAEVGFWVTPRRRGAGLATMAVGLVVDWARSDDGLGLHRVVARCDPANKASISVLAANGFTASTVGDVGQVIMVLGS